MLEMFMNSATLFVKGNLFQNSTSVMLKVLIGLLITAFICLALVKLGASMWVATAAAAFIGGAIQPYLFKDLKYK